MEQKSRGPKELAPVHIQILDFMLANSHMNYKEIAAHFGYTQGWLSQIIHSDAFQALLKERQEECFSDVRLTIKDRVVGLGHLVLDRLCEKIPTEQDTANLVNVAEMTLKALGYGPKGGGAPTTQNSQTNIIVGQVDKSTLEAARSLMHRQAEKPVAAIESKDGEK